MASSSSNLGSPISPVSTTHLERTAHEPRDPSLHRVTISSVQQVTNEVRLLRLQPVEGERPIKFLPGQFLDVHIAHLPSAGGFSITSSPSSLRPESSTTPPYIEVAIQHSPTNPHALYLTTTPAPSLLTTPLAIRVGGSFTWPPVLSPLGLHRAVFIAGGIGINPLMSMVRHIANNSSSTPTPSSTQPEPISTDAIEINEKPPQTPTTPLPSDGPGFDVRILYSVRDPGPASREDGILFLKNLRNEILPRLGSSGGIEIFLTHGRKQTQPPAPAAATLPTPPPITSKPLSSRVHVHTPIPEETESESSSPSPSPSLSDYDSSDLEDDDDDFSNENENKIIFHHGRIRGEDVERVLGPVEYRAGTVVYVCGVPGMTEKLVRRAKKAEGMDERHVLYEKWW